MTSLLRARAPGRFNFYKTKNIMALEIEGRIKQKLAKQSGQGAKGSWTKQDFVLEYQDGNYPADVCLTAFGNDKVADLDKYQVGDSVKVAFNLRAREYNGRWYNDVRVWRIAPAGQSASAPAQQQAYQAPQNYSPAPQPIPARSLSSRLPHRPSITFLRMIQAMIFRSKSERKIPSFFTPSHFVTAPVGQWGAFSPYPLRRYALRALFIQPPVSS